MPDAPNCTITRKKEDGEDLLICMADGYPDDYKYEWDFTAENETNVNKTLDVDFRNKRSYLKLGDVPQMRTYICHANNTVGEGSICKITVVGKYMEALISTFDFLRKVTSKQSISSANS